MAQLANLSITAVAFVHRGANRKKFFLTKSDVNRGHSSKGDEMNKIIKKALQALMKSEEHKNSSADQLLTALKADEAVVKLKLSDEDFVVVKEDIEFFKSLSGSGDPAPSPAPAPAPADGNSDAQTIINLQKSVTSLQKTLEGQTKHLRMIEIRKQLADKAPFAAIDIEKEAELIYDLENSNPEAAKKMLDHFERTSTLLERSGVLNELGSSLPGNDSLVPGSELISEIAAGREELRKSDDGLTPQREIDVIVNLVKSKGPEYYDQYVSDHHYNARVGGRRLRVVE